MDAYTILDDPDYKNANLATKRVIFSRYVAKTPEFANANAETQHAIIEAAGIAEPEQVAPEDSSFSEVSKPVEPSKPSAEASPAKKAMGLPPAEQLGAVAGAGVGMEAGRREVKAARAARAAASEAVQAPSGRASGPKVTGASGVRNWMAAEAGQLHQLPESLMDIATDKTKTSETGAKRLIEEDLKRLQKIKDIGEGKYQLHGTGGKQLMLPPSEIERLEAEIAKKQRMSSLKGMLSEGSQKATRLLGKIPLGSTIMGAGAGLEGAQAYEAYKAGDYPLAALHGLGALGSAASLIPTPMTRLGGGALSLATIPAVEIYERLKKRK